ncbi:hypothetical protein K438DRAFT_2029855 [Mycena galopus ATCC 62051]|nr:hypothetical protein K438DRAFT_2029855 [Mycena galopus ATCC 62051]
MVLTRRATRAQNSIIRWLPNEILAAIVADVSRRDLVALCRTSRLIRDIATPLLYHAVSFSTVPQLEAFLRTMKLGSISASLARYVRRFSAADGMQGLRLSQSLVNTIISVLFQLCHLECLDLLNEAFEFTDMLDGTTFLKLSTFRYTLQPQTSSLLSSFLNRHPTITHLTLAKDAPFQHLDPIHLPALARYNGPSSFIPSLDPGSCIHWVCLLWYPDDPTVDIPLLKLGRIASPVTVVVLSVRNTVKASTVLGGVAAYLPRTQHFKFRKTGTAVPISPQDTVEITTYLESLASLSILELCDLRDGAEPQSSKVKDRETIASWSGACKSLRLIRLHGRKWRLVKGHWAVYK